MSVHVVVKVTTVGVAPAEQLTGLPTTSCSMRRAEQPLMGVPATAASWPETLVLTGGEQPAPAGCARARGAR